MILWLCVKRVCVLLSQCMRISIVLWRNVGKLLMRRYLWISYRFLVIDILFFLSYFLLLLYTYSSLLFAIAAKTKKKI